MHGTLWWSPQCSTIVIYRHTSYHIIIIISGNGNPTISTRHCIHLLDHEANAQQQQQHHRCPFSWCECIILNWKWWHFFQLGVCRHHFFLSVCLLIKGRKVKHSLSEPKKEISRKILFPFTIIYNNILNDNLSNGVCSPVTNTGKMAIIGVIYPPSVSVGVHYLSVCIGDRGEWPMVYIRDQYINNEYSKLATFIGKALER